MIRITTCVFCGGKCASGKRGPLRMYCGQRCKDRAGAPARKQARVLRKRGRKHTWDHSPRLCEHCTEEYAPKSKGQRFCSVLCRQAARRPADPRDRNRQKNRKRRTAPRQREPYTLAEIAERDGCLCQLCFGWVDMTLSGLETWGPNIDHILPLSCGGDDIRANVQLAHRKCNIDKSNSVPVPGGRAAVGSLAGFGAIPGQLGPGLLAWP